MAEIAERLRGELSDMLEMIRRAGGGVVFEEFPGDLEENALRPDEADAGRAGEAREASCVAQRMLIDEANRLAEALDRLRRGECGISEETELVAAAAARPTECARSAPSRPMMAPHGTPPLGELFSDPTPVRLSRSRAPPTTRGSRRLR